MSVGTTQSLNPFGLSPSGVNVNPFIGLTPGSTFSPYATQAVQQIFQLLQTVPYQVQQLQQLAFIQQHQLQQLQQIIQLIPAHVAQLQQHVQSSQQQPFGQIGGGVGSPGISPWGIAPQIFSQPGYVM